MAKTLQVRHGDLVRSGSNSGYSTISDRDKLFQDARENLTTSVNPLTGLGADLDASVGNVGDNPAEAFSYLPPMFEFQRRVTSSLRRLMSAQGRYSFAQRTAGELISDFSGVQVWPISADQRVFKWRVALSTLAKDQSVTIGGRVQR